jgi:ribosomal protein S18 acetylase RimI-like enzyme
MMASDAIRIHRARPEDPTEIALFEEAFDNPISMDETRGFLARRGHHLILGYLDGRPAGFVSAVEVLHPDKPPELFLDEIAVIERARRKGVARALIEELKELAAELGCISVWVLTDESNEPAMHLYRTTGGGWDGSHQVMFEWNLSTG